MLGITLDRPWVLAFCAVPIALLLLARFADRPPAGYTGAFEVWLAVARSRPDDARARRRRVPPFVWLHAVGLSAAVLAAAGPRPTAEDAAWRVLVDRTPSMYLPVDGEAGGDSRIERAAKLLLELLPGAEFEWIDAGDVAGERLRSSGLPKEWRAPPRAPRPAIEWSALDAPGTVWITDRVPDAAPLWASLSASGGALVPGLVGTRGDVAITWDGVALREVEGAASVRAIEFDDELGRTWSDVLTAWAEARGHARLPPGGGAASMRVLRSPGAAPAREIEFGRDGWRARGAARPPAPEHDADGALEAWLVSDEGLPLVTRGPGRVHVAMGDEGGFELVRGAEAFAVSFARLFDDCIEPAPGVVSLAERAAAGDARFALGRSPETTPASRAAAARWASALALVALASVLAATVWSRVGARTGDAARSRG